MWEKTPASKFAYADSLNFLAKEGFPILRWTVEPWEPSLSARAVHVFALFLAVQLGTSETVVALRFQSENS